MTENQTPEGNGTTTAPPPEPASPRRLDDLRRATDDPMVGGVAAGIARYFDIDPIIVRVAFGALSLAGLAGLVLYIGLWLVLPYDDGRPSHAAEMFRVGDHEPEFRKVGLLVTGVLGAAAAVGDHSWFWGGPVFGVLFLGGLAWLFVIRPRRRREAARETTSLAPVQPATGRGPGKPSQPPVLFGLTLAVAAVVLGALRLYGELGDHDLGHRTYLATGLVVVGLGLVLGAWWGRSRALVGIGVVLVAVLSLGNVLPNGDIGEHRYRPVTATDLRASYQHGIGRFELDLSDLDGAEDLAALAGRTVHVEAGIGETVVLVPEDLPVTVKAEERAGRIDVFGRSADGQGPDLTVPSDDADALVLDIDQTFGHIKVVRS